MARRKYYSAEEVGQLLRDFAWDMKTFNLGPEYLERKAGFFRDRSIIGEWKNSPQ